MKAGLHATTYRTFCRTKITYILSSVINVLFITQFQLYFSSVQFFLVIFDDMEGSTVVVFYRNIPSTGTSAHDEKKGKQKKVVKEMIFKKKSVLPYRFAEIIEYRT